MASLLSSQRNKFRWWDLELALVHVLEAHARDTDPTISRLPPALRRENPVLRRYFAHLEIPSWDVLAYIAPADGPWPERRLVTVFKAHPGEEEPTVLCLDGPRASPHRYTDAEGTRLCLWYPNDPAERRWSPSDGLVRLFDLARLHVLAEHDCRIRGGRLEDWPIEHADHGTTTIPASPRGSLALPAELPNLARPGRDPAVGRCLAETEDRLTVDLLRSARIAPDISSERTAEAPE